VRPSLSTEHMNKMSRTYITQAYLDDIAMFLFSSTGP
jgi:hypothetical protein